MVGVTGSNPVRPTSPAAIAAGLFHAEARELARSRGRVKKPHPAIAGSGALGKGPEVVSGSPEAGRSEVIQYNPQGPPGIAGGLFSELW